MPNDFYHGPPGPPDPHECHDHHWHDWGPHGPDGPLVPVHVWPDVYHPVPYGHEYKGNENLTLDDGRHWCPPRDHGRHGCHPEPCGCGHHSHLPCDFIEVMGNYLDLANRYINATTYHERCDCVNELARIKAKLKDMLKEFHRELETLDKDTARINNKLIYFIGKAQQIQKDLENNMIHQTEMETAFDEMKVKFEELKEAYEQYQDTNTTYTMTYEDDTLKLTGSDGSEQTVEIAPDTNTTYTISYANDRVTLTGSDGSTSAFDIQNVPEATSEDIQAIFA